MFLDGLDFCLIENNSLSADKELFLFKIRKKKGYSESERIETIFDKTKWRFRLNRDMVLNMKLKSVNQLLTCSRIKLRSLNTRNKKVETNS